MEHLTNNHMKILFILALFLCFLQLNTVSAMEFNTNSTLEEIQNFLNDPNLEDTLSFAEGDYSFLSNLNITRSINIIANGVVNIVGDGMSNLFDINVSNVVIKGLNINNYNIAINSTKGNLTIENNKINNTNKGILINDTNKTENSNISNVKIKNNSINTTDESIYLFSESTSSENKDNIKNSITNVSIENNTINSKNKEAIIIESDRYIKDIKIKDNNVKSAKKSTIRIKSKKNIENVNIYNNKVELSKNEIAEDQGAIELYSSDGNIKNSTISKNNIYSKKSNGIILYSNNNQNNKIENNIINIKEGSSKINGIYIDSYYGLSNLYIKNNNMTCESNGINLLTTETTTGTSGINNTDINKNNIKINIADVVGVYMGVGSSGNISNISVNQNIITIRDKGDAILFENYADNSNMFNIIFDSNNIITNGKYGHGIDLDTLGENSKIKNIKVINNNITSSETGYGFLAHSQGNMFDIFIKNNRITTNKMESIYLYSYYGSLNNISIESNDLKTTNGKGTSFYAQNTIDNIKMVGNTIISNKTSIYFEILRPQYNGKINNVNISYNRILSNGTSLILSTNTKNNSAEFNWWGRNDIAGKSNIPIGKHYIIKLVINTDKPKIGDKYSYIFSWNCGTIGNKTENLPFFESFVDNNNGPDHRFDGRYLKSFEFISKGLKYIVGTLDDQLVYLNVSIEENSNNESDNSTNNTNNSNDTDDINNTNDINKTNNTNNTDNTINNNTNKNKENSNNNNNNESNKNKKEDSDDKSHENNTNNHQKSKAMMKNTGIPLFSLIISLTMIFGTIISKKRK